MNKKRLLLMLFSLYILLINFTSCKKGENDPAISLRSRKARLVGDWKLKEGIETITYSTGEVETSTYNGSVKVLVKTGEPTETTVYNAEINFRKDGYYTMTTTDDDELRVIDGNWYFGTKNKNLDVKNKETLYLITEKYTYSNSGGTPHVIEMTGTYALSFPTVWQIDRLSNKELVILTDFTYSTSSGIATGTGTKTYIQD
jgi:hypothetical protein